MHDLSKLCAYILLCFCHLFLIGEQILHRIASAQKDQIAQLDCRLCPAEFPDIRLSAESAGTPVELIRCKIIRCLQMVTLWHDKIIHLFVQCSNLFPVLLPEIPFIGSACFIIFIILVEHLRYCIGIIGIHDADESSLIFASLQNICQHVADCHHSRIIVRPDCF